MNIALILSGGTGTRLGGGLPKQYIEVKKKPLIAYCLETFDRCKKIDAVHIVAQEAWHNMILAYAGHKLKGFSVPGGSRQLSILNGLKDILRYAAPEDNVIIHDAARPQVSQELILSCIDALTRHEGVVPVLPIKDTVYEGEGGRITRLLDRDRILAGQAPEGFRLGKYYDANLRLMPDRILDIHGSTEPAAMAGMDVVCIEGEESNYKITTSEDLERFRLHFLEK